MRLIDEGRNERKMLPIVFEKITWSSMTNSNKALRCFCWTWHNVSEHFFAQESCYDRFRSTNSDFAFNFALYLRDTDAQRLVQLARFIAAAVTNFPSSIRKNWLHKEIFWLARMRNQLAVEFRRDRCCSVEKWRKT